MNNRIEAARDTFRRGLLPQLSRAQREGLAQAIATNDPRLMHGSLCNLPATLPNADCKASCGCLIGFAGILAGRESVGELSAFFEFTWSKACGLLGHSRDQRQPGLNPLVALWDDCPAEARKLVAEEVALALKESTHA